MSSPTDTTTTTTTTTTNTTTTFLDFPLEILELVCQHNIARLRRLSQVCRYLRDLLRDTLQERIAERKVCLIQRQSGYVAEERPTRVEQLEVLLRSIRTDACPQIILGQQDMAQKCVFLYLPRQHSCRIPVICLHVTETLPALPFGSARILATDRSLSFFQRDVHLPELTVLYHQIFPEGKHPEPVRVTRLWMSKRQIPEEWRHFAVVSTCCRHPPHSTFQYESLRHRGVRRLFYAGLMEERVNHDFSIVSYSWRDEQRSVNLGMVDIIRKHAVMAPFLGSMISLSRSGAVPHGIHFALDPSASKRTWLHAILKTANRFCLIRPRLRSSLLYFNGSTTTTTMTSTTSITSKSLAVIKNNHRHDQHGHAPSLLRDPVENFRPRQENASDCRPPPKRVKRSSVAVPVCVEQTGPVFGIIPTVPI